jgi:serine/threonine protein kinase
VPEAEGYALAAQITSGVEALHAAGVAHRALCPECIFYADGARTTVKICALGSAEVAAAAVSSDQPTSRWSGGNRNGGGGSGSGGGGSGSSGGSGGGSGSGSGGGSGLGLPHYRAPEAWLPGPYEGTLADVWSVGCVLYELLHGKPCFDGASLAQLSLQIRRCAHRELAAALSPPASAVLRALLVREPQLRAGPRQMTHVLLPAWRKQEGAWPSESE